MSDAIERSAFEEAAFLQYYLSGIQQTKDPRANALQIHFVPAAGQKAKASFLSRTPAGDEYEQPTLNSAWWAWKARAEVATRKLEAAEGLAKAVVKFKSVTSCGPIYCGLSADGACFLFERHNYSDFDRQVTAALAAYKGQT
jgi:hypothetical protein